jgi:putative transposase
VEADNVADVSKKGALLRATFCFYDESGFSERPTVRRTWGKRGKTPVIRSTGSWKNISATGIVVTDAAMKKVRALCTFTTGAVRKEDTVRTLKHLTRHIKGPIALLWDGLAQHRANIVREFLERQRSCFVIIERFPAYAPELNPQEYVWAASKTKDMANFCPKEPGDLSRHAKKSIKRIQNSPHILRGALKRSGLFLGEGVV